MPIITRQRIEPADDGLRLPRQPVILFGRSPAERARPTGAPERTVDRRASRFEDHDLASLGAPSSGEDLAGHHPAQCGAHTAQPARDRRRGPGALWPPTRYHGVGRILAEETAPAGATPRYPLCHGIGDAAERRMAILRLDSKGWTGASIVGVLGIDRLNGRQGRRPANARGGDCHQRSASSRRPCAQATRSSTWRASA
jgi:hypothetical protein